MDGVRVEGGGWMRLTDYCATQGRVGNAHQYTTEMVTADEELLVVELGDRVVNEIVALAIDGWGALDDLMYMEGSRSFRLT